MATEQHEGFTGHSYGVVSVTRNAQAALGNVYTVDKSTINNKKITNNTMIHNTVNNNTINNYTMNLPMNNNMINNHTTSNYKILPILIPIPFDT